MTFSLQSLKDHSIIKGLSPIQIEALKFGFGATFLGTSGGLLFGGVTSLMRGIQETSAARAYLARSFKLFSIRLFSFKIILNFYCYFNLRYCWNYLWCYWVKFDACQ